MADYKVSDTNLTAVADAIRTKGGTSASLSFPDGFVTAIGNISGGGSTLITKTITSNGTYNAEDDSADGYSQVSVSVTANPANYVSGSFTGTTAGGAMSVTIPYAGSGFPIAGIIYPKNGTNKSGDAFAELIQKNVAVMFAFVKNDAGNAPTYNDISSVLNKCAVMSMYKSSDSSATSTSSGQESNTTVFRSNAASEAWSSCVRFNSNTSMSVYIASTSYGFAKDIEYAYQLIYST